MVVTYLLPPHKPSIPLLGSLFLYDPVDQWDEFRSFTFGVAGIVGAVFGLFQLHNSARRTRLTSIDTQTKVEAECKP